jgi:hypothetical protein
VDKLDDIITITVLTCNLILIGDMNNARKVILRVGLGWHDLCNERRGFQEKVGIVVGVLQ